MVVEGPNHLAFENARVGTSRDSSRVEAAPEKRTTGMADRRSAYIQNRIQPNDASSNCAIDQLVELVRTCQRGVIEDGPGN
jgi:hypothetical protein